MKIETKVKILFYIAKFLPVHSIEWNENENIFFRKYFKIFGRVRNKINHLSNEEREKLVLKYLIPTINNFLIKIM